MATQIVICDQPRLGVSKTAVICLSGVYHRLFRSAVTVMVIGLAVAFVVMVVGNSLLDRAVRERINQEVRNDLRLAQWVRWLSQPVQPWEIDRLLTDEDEQDRIQELATWAGLSPAELAALREAAQQKAALRRFLDRLPAGRRRALIRDRSTTQAVEWLTREPGLSAFVERLQGFKTVALPGGIEGLQRLSEALRTQASLRERMVAGHAQAIAGFRERFAGQAPRDVLLRPPGDLAETLRTLGFVIRSRELTSMQQAAQRDEAKNLLARAIREPALRTALARRLAMDFLFVTPRAAAALLASTDGAHWFVQQAQRAGLTLEIDREGVCTAAQALQWENRRERTTERLGLGDGAFWGLGERAAWLVLVSLIVCTVGIANAMLMSVTERFREIATMKCLGATDRTIMALFVLESCILGLAGGLVGAVLGVLLALGRGGFFFGTLTLQTLPFGSLAVVMLLALLYGVLLAGVAAVYPALVAARLAPMEAMRVE